MDVLVVGCDHYNTLWVCRSLGMADVNVTCVVYDEHKKKSFVNKSRYVLRGYVVNSISEFIELLLKLEFNLKVPIISTADVVSEIVDKNYTKLLDRYILPNCRKQPGGICEFQDKEKVLEIAKKIGFELPWSKSINLDKDDLHLLSDIPFPCIMKPRKSVAGKKTDFRICYNFEELLKAQKEIVLECKDVLLQEYVTPDFEFIINAIRVSGKLIIPGYIKKILAGGENYNLGMSFVCKTTTMSEISLDINLVEQLLSKIDYSGVFSIEFIRSGNKNYFLEMNLRTDATLFVSVANGVNLPFLLLKGLSGEKLSSFLLKYNTEASYGMAEVGYLKTGPFKKPIRMIKTLRKMDVFSIFNRHDIKPLLYKFLYYYK